MRVWSWRLRAESSDRSSTRRRPVPRHVRVCGTRTPHIANAMVWMAHSKLSEIPTSLHVGDGGSPGCAREVMRP